MRRAKLEWHRDGDCIICTSPGPATGGYPKTERTIDGKRTPVRINRLVCGRRYGPLPKGVNALHSCDKPACINPDHLTPGTQLENIQQMVSRGRSLRGLKNPRAKITEEMVLKIRSDKRSKKEIAACFGVAYGVVVRIKNRTRWAYLQ